MDRMQKYRKEGLETAIQQYNVSVDHDNLTGQQYWLESIVYWSVSLMTPDDVDTPSGYAIQEALGQHHH